MPAAATVRPATTARAPPARWPLPPSRRATKPGMRSARSAPDVDPSTLQQLKESGGSLAVAGGPSGCAVLA
jgi:hypothetical protein